MQIAIPCSFMRGGTLRGPLFLESDLPAEIAIRDCVLPAAMVSPTVSVLTKNAGMQCDITVQTPDGKINFLDAASAWEGNAA